MFIEYLIETNFSPIGKLLLSYPKENRNTFIQSNTEFIENNDTSDADVYFEQLRMFTQILKEKNSEVDVYTTYFFLQNVVIDHLAHEWEKQYKQYFDDINKLSLDESIERYCSIETINHQQMATAGVFIYYLIKQGKFGKGNNSYFDSLNAFLPKINKALESKKYKDFVGKLKSTSSKKRHTIDDIDLMDGQEFEKFAAELFSKMGFETKITKATGDQGIDIIASKNGDNIGIQAKCYSSTVGNGAIQEAVAGKNYYRLDKAMVITNNFFTDSARQLAEANSIILWDRNNLMEKIERFFVS
ncbi:MAG: restriction endonuclease [Anaerolineales bacterium]|nr:restriction endonuclease [Anaerolineales bacterium]